MDFHELELMGDLLSIGVDGSDGVGFEYLLKCVLSWAQNYQWGSKIFVDTRSYHPEKFIVQRTKRRSTPVLMELLYLLKALSVLSNRDVNLWHLFDFITSEMEWIQLSTYTFVVNDILLTVEYPTKNARIPFFLSFYLGFPSVTISG
ncbi:hypothetical protein Tco_0300968 [Tanacetum coccineum]